MHADVSTLPNGITVITSPMPYLRSVSVVLTFRVGSRYESAGQAGICHFIEHMLFKGTRRYPTARLLSEAIEGVGGDLMGSTDKETTIYSVKIGADKLDRAVAVLAELVRAPLFAPPEVEKERRVIIEELNMLKDTPQEWVQVMLDELLFRDSPLGREVVGSRETLAALARDDLAAFFAASYTPANLIVSVAGATTHAAAIRKIADLFGDWPAATPPRWTPCVPAGDGPRVAVSRRDTEQATLCLAVPALGHDDPDATALALLNALLGDGMSSRLFQSIREEHGLAYDIGSSVSSFYETGVFEVSAGCDPDRAVSVIGAVLDEVRQACDAPPTAAELSRVKEYFRGRLVIGLEDTYSVASWRAAQMALRGSLRSIETIAAQVDAVTAADIQRVARRLWRADAPRLAAIGPLPPAERFEPLLAL